MCLEVDMKDRLDIEDVIDDLTKNSELLIPCLNAPTTSVVFDDSETFEIPASSCQNTITQSNAAKFTSVINRRSFYGSSSQEKLNGVNVKRWSGSNVIKSCPNKSTIKTFIPVVVGRPRSNSLDTPNDYASEKHRHSSGSKMTYSPSRTRKERSKRHSEEFVSLAYHNKYIPLLSNNAYIYNDQSSDYYSDTSKEMCQNITSV